MNGLSVEEVALADKSLSADIAQRLANRITFGAAVIVAREPVVLLSSVRKQWMKVLYQTRKARASTLKADTIAKLSAKIGRMESARFAADVAIDEAPATVTIATIEQCIVFAPECPTLYVATPVDNETLHKITSFMPEDGMVVIYRVGKNS